MLIYTYYTTALMDIGSKRVSISIEVGTDSNHPVCLSIRETSPNKWLTSFAYFENWQEALKEVRKSYGPINMAKTRQEYETIKREG